MPTFIFNEIECIRPKEAKDDEVYLNLSTENIGYYRRSRSDEGTALWGPTVMEEGDTISLQRVIDHIEFHEYLHIELWDDDPDPGIDNQIGELTITSPYEYGYHDIWFPGGLVGHREATYRLNYEIREEPLSEVRYRLELLSLACVDAQGTKDRVAIYTGNRWMWEHVMRTNQVESLLGLSHDFVDHARVQLRETRGLNWSRAMTVRPDERLDAGPQNFSFVKEQWGLTGTARYALQYRIRSISA